MNIYVMNGENQHLQVEFTSEEQENSNFVKAVTKILNKYDGELLNGVLHISPKKNQKKDNIGQLVDDIREDLIGDVLPDEDPKKDKKDHPKFKFTVKEAQPEPELGEIKPEEIKEDNNGKVKVKG